MAEVTPTSALDEYLNGPEGPIFRWLAEQAVKVETQAKLNATGIPVDGAINPESRGPRVRTGRLRSSITWAPGRDAKGPYVEIGTPVFYGGILERGELPNGNKYPFLVPALSVL